jgi:hypothetical protein
MCEKLDVATTPPLDIAWRNKRNFLKPISIKHSEKAQKWAVSSASSKPYLWITAMVAIAEPLYTTNSR